MMRAEPTANMRASERRPFQGTVYVSWQDPSGEMKTVRAKCVDISDCGARIECQIPIDIRTNVYLQAPGRGLMGNATVRYCLRRGVKYMIGLMFSSVLSEADQGRKRCLVQSQQGAEKTYAC